MPHTSSSVNRDIYNVTTSGTVAPSSHRRASCPTIDTPCNGAGGSGARIRALVTPQGHVGVSTKNSASGTAADGNENDPSKCIVLVRTFNDSANNEEIDVSALTDDDLRNLKRDDPFAYYSVPTARRRSSRLLDDDDDDGPIEALPSSVNRRLSLPAEVLSEADIARSRLGREAPAEGPGDSFVRRNRRFSTEAHPSLVCYERLQELRALDDGDIDEDLEMLDMDFDYDYE